MFHAWSFLFPCSETFVKISNSYFFFLVKVIPFVWYMAFATFPAGVLGKHYIFFFFWLIGKHYLFKRLITLSKLTVSTFCASVAFGLSRVLYVNKPGKRKKIHTHTYLPQRVTGKINWNFVLYSYVI